MDRSDEPSPPPRARRRWPWLVVVAGAAVGLVVTLALWLRCGVDGCPNIDRLQSFQPGNATQVLDREGNVFAELRAAEGETARLATIPQHVRDAFMAVEDQRFQDHGGVDWRRVGGAVLANLRKGGVAQGFSTITMQLARNVFPDRLPASARTMTRKLLEVRVAYAIERRYSKDEILELYLSHVYFGNGARGIDAASRHYFGQGAPQLTIAQGALLAAMLKAPTNYDPRRAPDRAKNRRDLVLTLMERQGRISKEAATAAREQKLGVVRRKPSTGQDPGLAPWFVEEVRRRLDDEIGERLYEGGLVVQTTLDPRLQRAAEEELGKKLGAVGPAGTEPLQGAVVALQTKTGDVLAWVGGRDFEASRFDRVKNARRQAGSAFKPFVYATALEEGRALSERLVDEPMTIKLDRTHDWKPKNFDGRFEGVVSMRDALVRSKNVPTIHLGEDVGLGKVQRLAQKCGITGEMDKTPAMPLGTVTVSPLELAAAYVPFATLGRAVEPRLVLAVRTADGAAVWTPDEPQQRSVLAPGVAYLVTSALQEAVNRGTGKSVRRAGFKHAVAGKTGTTSGALDAWFVGYTPDVVAAVWLGYDTPRTISADTTGGRIAAPIWGHMMARGGGAASEWARPDNVVPRWVDAASGAPIREGCVSSGRTYEELFLRARLPDEVCPSEGAAALGAPDAGALLFDVALLADVAPPDGGAALDDDADLAAASDVWPDAYDRSEPAPPPEREEAERAADRATERMEREDERAQELEELEDEAAQAQEARDEERAQAREEQEEARAEEAEPAVP